MKKLNILLFMHMLVAFSTTEAAGKVILSAAGTAGAYTLSDHEGAWSQFPSTIKGVVVAAGCVFGGAVVYKYVIPHERKKATDALFKAVMNGRIEDAKVAIRGYSGFLGADINAQDENGMTPIALAAANGFDSMVMLLLRNKADQTIMNNDGLIPIQLAATKRTPTNRDQYNNIIKLLCFSIVGDLRYTDDIVAKALDPQLFNEPLVDPTFRSTTIQDSNGDTVLHHAVRTGDANRVELIRTLLLRGQGTQLLIAIYNLEAQSGVPLPIDVKKEQAVGVLKQMWKTLQITNNDGEAALQLTSNPAIQSLFSTIPAIEDVFPKALPATSTRQLE